MQPKRTILYYPTIRIPTTIWLRQALLYWDEIASIVPRDYEDNAFDPYTPEIQYLKSEGQFRPIRPETFVADERGTKEFHKELILWFPLIQIGSTDDPSQECFFLEASEHFSGECSAKSDRPEPSLGALSALLTPMTQDTLGQMVSDRVFFSKSPW